MANAGSFGYPSLPATTVVYAVPPIDPAVVTEWATSKVYVSGALVNMADGVYHCVIPGTSSNTVHVFSGDDVVDAGVTWRKAMRRARTGVSFTVVSANDVYMSFPSAAGAGVGTLLKSTGSPHVISYTGANVWQGAVSFYSAGTFSIYGQEW